MFRTTTSLLILSILVSAIAAPSKKSSHPPPPFFDGSSPSVDIQTDRPPQPTGDFDASDASVVNCKTDRSPPPPQATEEFEESSVPQQFETFAPGGDETDGPTQESSGQGETDQPGVTDFLLNKKHHTAALEQTTQVY